MSKIVVAELEGPSTTSNKITIATGSQLDLVGSTGTVTLDAADITAGNLPSARLPIGTVVQVVSANSNALASYTMRNSGSSTNYGLEYAGFDLTSLNVSITPTSTSNKILILFNAQIGYDGSAYGVMRLKRCIGAACTPALDGTAAYMSPTASMGGVGSWIGSQSICNKDVDGHEAGKIVWHFMDSPNTVSNVSYVFNIGIEADGTSSTFYLNRNFYGIADYGQLGGVSSVTLMEIKA